MASVKEKVDGYLEKREARVESADARLNRAKWTEDFTRRCKDTSPFRIETWYESIAKHTFRTWVIPLTLQQANRILAFREELRLRLQLRDQETRETGIVYKDAQAFDKPEVVEELYQFILSSMPHDARDDLRTVQHNIQHVASRCRAGVFVRLSTRSPKDATVGLPKVWNAIRQRIHASRLDPTSPGTG